MAKKAWIPERALSCGTLRRPGRRQKCSTIQNLQTHHSIQAAMFKTPVSLHQVSHGMTVCSWRGILVISLPTVVMVTLTADADSGNDFDGDAGDGELDPQSILAFEFPCSAAEGKSRGGMLASGTTSKLARHYSPFRNSRQRLQCFFQHTA